MKFTQVRRKFSLTYPTTSSKTGPASVTMFYSQFTFNFLPHTGQKRPKKELPAEEANIMVYSLWSCRVND